ncbi:uncharacterized protein TNCT_449941 [Trichonephila clavata]|uniref:Uncharacterized protein n=1 Tax=Trichonephila clavata TaxID=2740835 RepID=A0A8X6IEG5_TRICU|nr:uncharacterized protein TNCT_449941 [Trichonephila clavata]
MVCSSPDCSKLRPHPVGPLVVSESQNTPEVENADQISPADRFSPLSSSSDKNENSSDDVLELYPSLNEMQSLTDEENQAPISIEEVAKDLQVSEKDSELLELEMRARAIRSLLKARGQEVVDSD